MRSIVIVVICLSINTRVVSILHELMSRVFKSLLNNEFLGVFILIMEKRGWTISWWLWLLTIVTVAADLKRLFEKQVIIIVAVAMAIILIIVIVNELHYILVIFSTALIITGLQHHAHVIILQRLDTAQILLLKLLFQLLPLLCKFLAAIYIRKYWLRFV